MDKLGLTKRYCLLTHSVLFVSYWESTLFRWLAAFYIILFTFDLSGVNCFNCFLLTNSPVTDIEFSISSIIGDRHGATNKYITHYIFMQFNTIN